MLPGINTSLFKPGDRVGIAVSGGADSVALLRALIELGGELGLVLSVVHFNHKLRGEESEADERFVTELAAKYGLALHRMEADTKTLAREKTLSIEAAARELRYSYFGKLIRDGVLDKVATAHTLDDQAETVLFRVIRGTGTSGLAGILPRLKAANGAIVRPFLKARRAEIVRYLNERKQDWRDDSTNAETVFTRNRIRHELLPKIAADFNPEITEALANLAEIARAEDEFWASATADAFVHCYRKNALDVPELLKLHKAMQRRVLRLAAIQRGASLDFARTERILDALSSTGSKAQKTIELPNGFRALFNANQLAITTEEPQPKPCGYSYSLAIPGEVAIPGLRLLVRARFVRDSEDANAYNDDHKLAAARLASELRIRNWQPGDRFWPAHSRGEKKVKELLQERHVSSREKSLWPVALLKDEIVWMWGFPVSARYLAKPNEPAVVVEDLPL